MSSLTKYVFSSLKSAYRNINPSTLTGAIDVIVVKQEDETLRCTPFHVRFGKLGVLKSQQNKVYITINGDPVEDIYMELGDAGEAVFIQEELVTQSPSSIHHVESSDSNIWLDADNVVPNSSDFQPSNTDFSSNVVSKELDEQTTNENNVSQGTYAGEQSNIPTDKTDELNANAPKTNRQRQSLRSLKRNDKSSKSLTEDADREVENILSPNENSLPIQQHSSTVPFLNNSNGTADCKDNGGRRNSSMPTLPEHSINENEILQFPIDDEKESTSSTPFVDAPSRMNSIDSRKKLSIILPTTSIDVDNDGSFSSSLGDSTEDEANYPRTVRTLSNPIPIEHKLAKVDTPPTTDESNSLIDATYSQSVPVATNDNSTSMLLDTSKESAAFFLNDSLIPSSLDSSIVIRPTSAKSDSEFELDKSAQQSARNNRSGSLWRWKWGGFPEQRRSMLRYLWPSSTASSSASKPIVPKEEKYLDDITNNSCDERSRYLPVLEYLQNLPKTPKDEDQESGTGNSIPNSPIRECETFHVLGDVQLSLCGNIDKPALLNDDLFNSSTVPYETFIKNPSIINDPNLVVRIGGKFYNWDVASAIIATASVYHKNLPVETVEDLQNSPMIKSTPRSSSGLNLWPFSSKSSTKEKEKPLSVNMSTEALALVVKSEVVPPVLQKQNSIGKQSNDSESENRNVSELTNKTNGEPVISANTSTSKKTLLLTSDQLKRLNLKYGQNEVEFSVTTALQGTTVVEANIFFFDYKTKFVISDIDGTITKSDVVGHLFALIGRDWSHDGITHLFQAINENGYQFMYLSARAIGQSQVTRNFLRSVKQYGVELPVGPLLISPDSLVTALYREVIARKPEEFKIECLKNIASLFPNKNPFYAGFGNRTNDQSAYMAVGIPETRIFTINPRSEVILDKVSQVLLTSYKNLHEVVDHVFPPTDSFHASECYSSFTYWRTEPLTDSFHDEMQLELDKMNARQKSKGKGSPTQSSNTSQKQKSTKENSENTLHANAQTTGTTVKKS